MSSCLFASSDAFDGSVCLDFSPYLEFALQSRYRPALGSSRYRPAADIQSVPPDCCLVWSCLSLACGEWSGVVLHVLAVDLSPVVACAPLSSD